MRAAAAAAAAASSALALTLLLVATSARAQQVSQADALAAEALFREAKELATAGKTSEACPKFAESHRLDPQIGTLLHLATCHSQEGKTATAWAEFLQAADLASRVHDDAREKIARDRAEKLATTVPRVLLQIDPANPPLEISLDGQRVRASSGVPIPVDPGAHTIQASAPSRSSWSQQITVANAAGTQTIQVPILATAAGTTSPSSKTETPVQPPQQSGGTLRYVGYGVGALGVVAIGVGTVFGVKSLSDKSASDEACTERGCTAAGLASYEDARSAAWICNIALGVGVVALAAGIVLVLTSPSASASASPAASASISIKRASRGVAWTF